MAAATFFWWGALYLYVPVLPVYARSLGASLSMVGAVVSSYAIAQLLLRIPLGLGSDALGKRKPFVVAGILITIAGALGLGLAPNVWLLFLARAVTGLGAATWVIFTVMFTSYYAADNSSKAIGMISFVNAIALVASTSAGGALAEVFGFGATFYGAAILGLVSLVMVLPVKEPPVLRTQAVSWQGFIQVASRPQLLLTSVMSILLQFVMFAGIFGFTPVYAAQIGASKTDLGIITMLVLGASALTALLAAHLAERYGYPLAILGASLLISAAVLATPFIQQVFLLELAQVAFGAGRGVLFTLFLALSIQAVAPERRATAMGVYQAIYSVGMLLGPLVSGFLADGLGLSIVFYLSAALCLALGVMAYLPWLPRSGRTIS